MAVARVVDGDVRERAEAPGVGVRKAADDVDLLVRECIDQRVGARIRPEHDLPERGTARASRRVELNGVARRRGHVPGTVGDAERAEVGVQVGDLREHMLGHDVHQEAREVSVDVGRRHLHGVRARHHCGQPAQERVAGREGGVRPVAAVIDRVRDVVRCDGLAVGPRESRLQVVDPALATGSRRPRGGDPRRGVQRRGIEGGQRRVLEVPDLERDRAETVARVERADLAQRPDRQAQRLRGAGRRARARRRERDPEGAREHTRDERGDRSTHVATASVRGRARPAGPRSARGCR